jgi:hypothetical protein
MKLENQKIIYISEETLVGQKETPKISFVVEETGDSEYKNSLLIDLIGEKTGLIKSFRVGDIVDVSLSCRTKEFNDKRFNTINARKIELVEKAPMADEDLPF